ncbi:MAG: M12 family metallo-peptidase [Bacteroidales bacterium]|jgi:hypothetical protein|nr:M12 family metallo-peptidase [Bacteroidales bacterium]
MKKNTFLLFVMLGSIVTAAAQPFTCGAVPDTENIRQTKVKVPLRAAAESNAAVTVDLLVLYTSAANAMAVKDSMAIDTLINRSVQRANLVMQNSNTNVTFRIVHIQEVNYTESATNTNNDLVKLRKVADDEADEAHALRTQYNADMVLMVVGDNSSGVLGAGYILNSDGYGGSPSSAFSVMKFKALSSGYVMVHEMGHNFGCGHHKETDNNSLYGYSHGYKGTTTNGDNFCTVMTYENSSSGFFPRIPYFSDPNISFGGVPVGSESESNNAKTIRQTKELIANYSSELPYTDNFLRNINLSAGTLSPEFNAGIRQYTVTVPGNVTSIDIEGEANSPYSAVSGNVKGKILSASDSNVVEIKVEDSWSNNGVRTYTVTIVKQDFPAAPPVVFPKTNAVTYNPAQKLRNVTLADGSGDGTFAWENPDTVPTVNNTGYKMVFNPNDTVNYDYTDVVLYATVSLTVYKSDQIITFPAIEDKQWYDLPFNINASVNTALPLIYRSSDTNVVTVSSGGLATIVDSGTVTITVSQAGDDNYNPAAAQQTFTVHGQQPSVITERLQHKNSGICPNPVRAGEYVRIEKARVVEIRDITGRLLQRLTVDERSDGLFIKAPDKTGIYFINNKKLVVI